MIFKVAYVGISVLSTPTAFFTPVSYPGLLIHSYEAMLQNQLHVLFIAYKNATDLSYLSN